MMRTFYIFSQIFEYVDFVRVGVTLQLAVYRQLVRLSDKPLYETHDQ
jgi:hypothetical protein